MIRGTGFRAILLAVAVGCAPKAPVTSPAVPEAINEAAPPVESEGSAEAAPEPTPEPEVIPVHEQVNEASALLSDPDATSNIQKAMGMLEKIIAENPNAAHAHFNLGVGYQLMEDYERARREYQAAVNIDPELGNAWLYQGVLHENEGRFEQAISNYRTGVRNNPENMELRVALIGLLRKQGDVDGAVEESKKALKINSNSLDVYNNMGLAYIDLEEYALAQFVYQKALTLEGADQNAYIRCNYGWTMYLKGEKGLATFQLKKAVELDPELVPALIYLSKLYMEDRNYTDTIELLERAAANDPENHGVQMNLGVAYRGVGRLEESAKAYQTAIALEPENHDPYYNLGILYGDYTKEYSKSIESFQMYIDAGGEGVELAEEYLAAVTLEMERAEKRRLAEEKRKKRDAERAERKRLLEEEKAREAAEAAKAAAAPPEEPPVDVTDGEVGSSDAAPEGQETDEGVETAPVESAPANAGPESNAESGSEDETAPAGDSGPTNEPSPEVEEESPWGETP